MVDEARIKSEVKQRYAAIARAEDCKCSPSCCAEGSESNLQLIDYGSLDAELPEGANLGLGCGLPTQSAGIKAGDTVLDLGSGAGVDVFLAAKIVGDQGLVIGVDMTIDMVKRAGDNALKGGYHNVEFRLGEVEALPVEDQSVDVVISNCVINLVPDKPRAFAEILRVLKPGGHFTISDIVTYGEVPEVVRQDMTLWAGCVAGAVDREDYLDIVRKAGFVEVHIRQQTGYETQETGGYGLASITLEGYKP